MAIAFLSVSNRIVCNVSQRDPKNRPTLYLSPMKMLSPLISPSDGRLKFLGRRPSQKRLARLLPIRCMKATWTHCTNLNIEAHSMG